MTVKEHLKINVTLAVPVMASQLGQVMVGVADNIMVGQVGYIPLAGASLGNAIFFFFMVFGLGVSFAITPLVGFAQGQGDKNKIGQVLRHGLVINTILGVILFVVVMVAANYLHLLGQEQAVVDQATPYMFVIGFSMVPFLVFQSFRQFSEGLSMTKIPMIVSVSMNILNIILNYILIYGKFGAPELGLLGAGIATLISRIMMAIVMVLYVLNHHSYKPFLASLGIKNLDFKLIKDLLRIGIPAGLQFVFEVGAFSMAALMMGWIGAPTQAAHQIAINMASISYMTVAGLGAAAAIRVGNQLGKKNYKTMKNAALTLIAMGTVLMVVFAAVFIIGKDALPLLYNDKPEVVSIAAGLLIIAALFQISDGIQVISLGALRGMKDVKIPTWITFFSYWIIALPLGYVLAFNYNYGAMGIWYGLFLGLTIAGVWVFIRFLRLSNKQIASSVQ
ncbi:MAG: MATE family efflux transporter [Cyclobacteriaceae bacterium]|nr:MATE family efflux transporter [Cyclobacteriaceae bacterium]